MESSCHFRSSHSRGRRTSQWQIKPVEPSFPEGIGEIGRSLRIRARRHAIWEFNMDDVSKIRSIANVGYGRGLLLCVAIFAIAPCTQASAQDPAYGRRLYFEKANC